VSLFVLLGIFSYLCNLFQKTYKVKRITLFVLGCAYLSCFAQKAVVISEISSPFSNSSDKIVELYNASDSLADIGGCRLYTNDKSVFDYTIPNGISIAAKSTYTFIFTTTSRWTSEISKISVIANSTNRKFSNKILPDGPLYFYDRNGVKLDYLFAANAQRLSVVLDGLGNLVENATSSSCFSGDYSTTFTPTLLTTDIVIKRRHTLAFEYDNSGNRIGKKVIYIQNLKNEQTTTTNNTINHSTFVEMDLLRDDKTLLIYPNPVRGNLNIKTTGNNLNYDYKIYSVNGVEMLNGNITEAGEESVDMGNFR